MIARALCVVVLVTCCMPHVAAEFVLNSRVLTSRGVWKPWQQCPDGLYVTGMDVHVDGDSSGPILSPHDNVGLVGLVFECGSLGSGGGARQFVFSHVEGVESTVATTTGAAPASGTALRMEYAIVYEYPLRSSCGGSGVAVGFELYGQEDQGSRDNKGALNLRLLCSNLRENEPPYIEAYGGYDGTGGTWTGPRSCGKRQAICGLQTQSAPLNASSLVDNIAIENIRLLCCDIPNPATDCSPEWSWTPVEQCDPLATTGSRPRPCNYTRTTGIGLLASLSEPEYQLYEWNNGVGYEDPRQMTSSGPSGDGSTHQTWLLSALSTNILMTLPNLSEAEAGPGGYNWRNSPERTWEPQSKIQSQFDGVETRDLKISQLIVKCGYFVVRTGRFRVSIGGVVTYHGV